MNSFRICHFAVLVTLHVQYALSCASNRILTADSSIQFTRINERETYIETVKVVWRLNPPGKYKIISFVAGDLADDKATLTTENFYSKNSQMSLKGPDVTLRSTYLTRDTESIPVIIFEVQLAEKVGETLAFNYLLGESKIRDCF